MKLCLALDGDFESFTLIVLQLTGIWTSQGGDKRGPFRGGGGGGGEGVVMSAVAVLKSSMSLFETCQMSPSEFRKNSRNHVDNTFLVYRSHHS
jgi:hypothetical protein